MGSFPSLAGDGWNAHLVREDVNQSLGWDVESGPVLAEAASGCEAQPDQCFGHSAWSWERSKPELTVLLWEA